MRNPITETLVTVGLMLSVAPLTAVTTLVCLWGKPLNPFEIITMAFFGIITTPLWPSYIPALILTPLMMQRLSATGFLKKMPPLLFFCAAPLLGCVAGVFVVSPLVWIERNDPNAMARNWAISGAIAGAVTLTLVAWLYRCRGHEDGKASQR